MALKSGAAILIHVIDQLTKHVSVSILEMLLCKSAKIMCYHVLTTSVMAGIKVGTLEHMLLPFPHPHPAITAKFLNAEELLRTWGLWHWGRP